MSLLFGSRSQRKFHLFNTFFLYARALAVTCGNSIWVVVKHGAGEVRSRHYGWNEKSSPFSVPLLDASLSTETCCHISCLRNPPCTSHPLHYLSPSSPLPPGLAAAPSLLWLRQQSFLSMLPHLRSMPGWGGSPIGPHCSFLLLWIENNSLSYSVSPAIHAVWAL